MKRYSLIVLLLLLSGCATEAKYKAALSTWVGEDELSLVRKWGAPQQVYESGGHRFIVYSNSSDVFIPGQAPTYQTTMIGNTAYTNSYGGTPAMSVNMSCTTTFELVDGKIVGGSYRGNNCTSK